MKNVAAYIRVSTDGQIGEDKFGLEAQKEQIISYCQKNDMEIIQWYSDEGESGAKYRPGFDEIVYGEVSNPPIESVVVAKSDRVARDINIYFYYQACLLRKNIELISVQEDFGQFGVFSNALKAFVLICAEMERDNITKRTSAGRKVKAAKGGYSGGRPPFGYKAHDGQLVINPAEAETIKCIFSLFDSGVPYAKMVDALSERGFFNKKGNPFSTSVLSGIINNRPLYNGFYKYSNGEWVKGQHEPILPPDDNRDDPSTTAD